MKPILVVFTGGTIGSRISGTTIQADSGESYVLLDMYRSHPDSAPAEFETIQPLALLSENMLPANWSELIEAIRSQPLARYGGIIVTHGTDTLPYTAAALAYTLGDAGLPIVLTASNHPPAHPKSEAVRNFQAAVDFIQAGALTRGVYVVFGDERGELPVYLGTRLLGSQSFTDTYASASVMPYGYIRNREWVWCESNIHPSPEAVNGSTGMSNAGWKQEASFTSKIAVIRPYPGIDYKWFVGAGEQPEAVLHELYHSGTAGSRAAAGGESLEAFAGRLRRAGIDLYAAPMRGEDEQAYATAGDMLASGMLPLRRVTAEAALVKLMLVYGSIKDAAKRREAMKLDLFYEHVRQVRQP